MDSRPFFIFGDLAGNIVCGAFVALICWLIFDPTWNMVLAMFVAMAIGMVLSMVVYFPFAILFGAMEVMVPFMLTGMYSGMVVGMWASMHTISVAQALQAGALTGLATIAIVFLVNTRLRGKTRFAPSEQAAE